MQHITIDLSPEQYHKPELMRLAVEKFMGAPLAEEATLRVVRRTLDCRKRNIIYHTDIAIAEEHLPPETPSLPFLVKPLSADAPCVVVVGAGPAGLFASLTLLAHGIRPIIVERGKRVEERKYDVARMAREQVVDPDSNWCFGEGGAGTYSDGKLYTRSTKRGDVGAVLRTFVAHGADPDIMLDAHAHIGTDRLSGIIARMRQTIETSGGRYYFGTRMADLMVHNGKVMGVIDGNGNLIEGKAVILCTGHSARDVYRIFANHQWLLEAKPFALGVRVEHPQQLINEIQYHGHHYSPYLPPATYNLATQAGTHGVFSFCMCPGGVIVPAATASGQQVVNGMSNHLRNSPYANSGIAVTVSLADLPSNDATTNPLALLEFQQAIEKQMFHAGGDSINAPAQRLVDFLHQRPSSSIGKTGYLGATVAAPLHELLPPFVVKALAQGFRDFDRKMRGFITQDATLLAVESRTSSPVRIPRTPTTLQHPQLQGLYPCGEGAGYAGGIVSSALDGIRCAEAVSLQM